MTKLQKSGKPQPHSSAYAPKFKNPVLLPSVDNFRLGNILSTTLLADSEAVAQSLLNVNSKYQTDLRLEIRRALTIEQRIQYKNIQVAKLAHNLQKSLDHRRKRFNRILQKKGSEASQSSASVLASDVDRLLDLAQKTSASAQSLSKRLANLDRANGGSGLPNSAKYPRLARLLHHLDLSDVAMARMDEGDVYSASLEEPQLMEDYMNGAEHLDESDFPQVTELSGAKDSEARLPSLETSTASQKGESASNGQIAKINGQISESNSQIATTNGQSARSPDEVSENHERHSKKINLLPSSSIRPQSSPPHEFETAKLETDSDVEMDAEAFALLIDSNVEKYRRKRSSLYKELELFSPQATSKYRGTANPLRLLYSSSNLQNSDMLQAFKSPEVADTLHSPFVQAKSIATVSETPQLSLHKKLRINALPMSYSSSLLAQTCECAPSKDSPAKKALAATLLRDVPPDLRQDDDELWSSSGPYTETEENESDQLLWSSSSDPDSSSDSQNNNTATTNEYYMALRKNLSSKRKHKAKKKTRMSFNAEASPTPKHQPSHRILKPHQSILKMKSSVAKSRLKPLSPSLEKFLPEPNLDTPYRSSPRGSFVNNYSAIGLILQSGEQDQDNATDDGDLEDNEVAETDFVANSGQESTGEPSRTVSKLRKLLI